MPRLMYARPFLQPIARCEGSGAEGNVNRVAESVYDLRHFA